jgi:hypothetical protein
MSRFKQHFGLDWVDLGVHVVVTGIIAAAIDSLTPNAVREPLILGTVGASVLLFALRRSLALRRARLEPVGLSSGEMAAERIHELEQRVADLELGQSRMAELEERLDFAERLLAQAPPQGTALPRESAR